ncbi:MAG: HYR domain-containing protein, partial [Chloroflexi bacterium]|nr:HYR domain-containing protein [Chloroflexota bacterium]
MFAGLFWSGLIPLGAGVPLAQGQELPDPVVITIEESIVLGDTPVAGDSDIGVTETLGVDESYAAEGQADTTPPEISVPANVVVQATNASGQVVTYSAATAFDNQDPNPSLSCAPASGSTFDLGSTTVQCSSADASGNTGSRSFTVVVQDTVPPVLTQIPDLKREVTDPKGGPMAFAVPTATDAVDTSVVVT